MRNALVEARGKKTQAAISSELGITCPAANYRRRKPQFKFGNYAYLTVQCGR